jgi:protein decreased size exclusion limit 1
VRRPNGVDLQFCRLTRFISIRVWDSRSAAAPLLTEQMHEDPLLCLALEQRGRRGACGAASARVVQFALDIPAGRLTKGVSHAAHAASAGSSARGTGDVSFREGPSGAGRLLAAATWDGRVRLFDCKASKPLASMRYHSAAATCVAWADNDAGELASGSRDGAVALWHIAEGHAHPLRQAHG